MKRIKAQLQIGETIFILIIFFILVIIGMVFYSQVEMQSASKTRQVDAEREILKSALEAIYLPELSCIELSKGLDEGCIDLYKLEAFMNLSGSEDMNTTMRLEYYDLFGDSEVAVKIIFPNVTSINNPSPFTTDTFVIFNKTLPRGSRKESYIPVVIKDPLLERNYFGYLKIKTAKR